MSNTSIILDFHVLLKGGSSLSSLHKPSNMGERFANIFGIITAYVRMYIIHIVQMIITSTFNKTFKTNVSSLLNMYSMLS